jgi:hypothetical protein
VQRIVVDQDAAAFLTGIALCNVGAVVSMVGIVQNSALMLVGALFLPVGFIVTVLMACIGDYKVTIPAPTRKRNARDGDQGAG